MGLRKTEPVKTGNNASMRRIGNFDTSLHHKKNKLLKGRYQWDKIIGRGLSGVVYKAWDILSDRPVAVKVITTANGEYEFIKQLSHPNLITYYNSFTEKDGKEEKRYLMLEYLPMNLAEYTKKAHQSNSNLCGDRLWQRKVRKMFKEVCSGVLYLHSLSIAHRDIKL